MKKAFLLFIFAMVLIKLPPFYFLPLTSKLFTSHVLAKCILTIVAALLIIIKRNRRQLNNKTLYILTIFFISQSISIITAQNLLLFFKDYQNLVSNILIFLNSYLFANNKENRQYFLKFIVFTGIFFLILELLYFLVPTGFLALGKIIIQKEVLDSYIYDLRRDRYNLYLHSEILLPFLIYYFTTYFYHKKTLRIFLFCLFILATLFLSIISNFRRRLFITVISILSSLFTFTFSKNATSLVAKKISLVIVLLLIFSFIGSLISLRKYRSYDIIDRLLLTEKQDLQTIIYRTSSFSTALELLLLSPLTGVGMGNYELYVNYKDNFKIFDKIQRSYNEKTLSDPHSIISKTLAETGIIGLAGFIFLIYNFIKNDIHYYKLYSEIKLQPYIIGFWLLFLYSLFSPFTTVFITGWFWLFRGIIEGTYFQKSPHIS